MFWNKGIKTGSKKSTTGHSYSKFKVLTNLYTKIVKILEVCKQFSENLVNEFGNVLLT